MTAAALEPVRATLRARASEAADRTRAEAEAAAEQVLTAARAEADTILATARAEGEADAAEHLAADRIRARRAARAVVLAARREAYGRLRSRAETAVAERFADPAFRRRIVRSIRSRLGAETQIRTEPGGGLIGSAADGRTVDASVAGLTERAMAGLEVDGLWSS